MVVRSHADASASDWGYIRQLGHPVQACHLWLLTRTPSTADEWPQGERQTSSIMEFDSSLPERYVNDSSYGAILIIAQDTTAGSECFCWTLNTYGGNEDLHRDSCHLRCRSPASSGWCSLAVLPSGGRPLGGLGTGNENDAVGAGVSQGNPMAGRSRELSLSRPHA